MAYNSRNHLLKIIEIQNIVLDEKKRGVTQKRVYDTIIRDRFHISERTFDNYLGRNAKRELSLLDASAGTGKTA